MEETLILGHAISIDKIENIKIRHAVLRSIKSCSSCVFSDNPGHTDHSDTCDAHSDNHTDHTDNSDYHCGTYD